jgi:phage shock protein A
MSDVVTDLKQVKISRITLGLILSVAVTSGVVVWNAAQVAGRIDDLEKTVAVIEQNTVLARLASIEEGVSTNADALESMRLARVEDTRNFASSTMMEIVVSDLEGVKRQIESVLDIVENGVEEFDEINERIDYLEYRVDLNEEACRSKKWCEDFYDQD